MKMLFALPFFVWALALATPTPAATGVTISVNHPTMTMRVDQTAEIYVESHGSWPGIADGTCGSYPPGKPDDRVAITKTHQPKLSTGGTLSLDVRAQHAGTCFIRYSVQSTASGRVEKATAQTDFTVKP
jgi:hypothetical protein